MALRPFTQEELQDLINRGYDVSSYKGEAVEIPDLPTPQSSSLAVGGRSALASALPTLASGAAFAGVMALAPETGGLSLAALPYLAGGMGAAYGAGKLTTKAQEALLPEAAKQQLARDYQTNPTAATIGSLAAMPLGGFAPSPTRMVKGLSAIPQFFGGKTATGERLAADAVARQALGNVAAGGILGGVQEAVIQPLEGREFSGGDIARAVGTGMLFNKPWALGKAYGFHDIPTQKTWQQKRDEQSIQHIESQQRVDPVNAVEKDNSAAELTPEQEQELARRAVASVQVAEPTVEQRIAAAQKAAVDALTPEQRQIIRDQGFTDEDINQGSPEWIRSWLKPVKPVKQEKAPVEEAPVKTFEQAAQETEADKIAAALKAAETKLPKGAKYQPEGEGLSGRVKTPLQEEVEAKRPEDMLFWPHSDETAQATGEHLRKAGITPVAKDKIEYQQKLPPDVHGPPAMKEAKAQARVEEGKEQVVLTPLAALDAPAHEAAGHHYINRLRASAAKGDKRAAASLAKWEAASKPGFEAYNKARVEAGLEPTNLEEFMASEQGMEFVKQEYNLDNESAFRTWLNDTKALLKTRWSQNATPEEVRRAMNFRYKNEPNFGKSKEMVKDGIVPGMAPVESKEQPSDEGLPSGKQTNTDVGSDFDVIYGTGYWERGGKKPGPVKEFDKGYSLSSGDWRPTTKEQVDSAAKNAAFHESRIPIIEKALTDAGLMKNGKMVSQDIDMIDKVEKVMHTLPKDIRGIYYRGSDIPPRKLLDVVGEVRKEAKSARRYADAIANQYNKTVELKQPLGSPASEAERRIIAAAKLTDPYKQWKLKQAKLGEDTSDDAFAEALQDDLDLAEEVHTEPEVAAVVKSITSLPQPKPVAAAKPVATPKPEKPVTRKAIASVTPIVEEPWMKPEKPKVSKMLSVEEARANAARIRAQIEKQAAPKLGRPPQKMPEGIEDRVKQSADEYLEMRKKQGRFQDEGEGLDERIVSAATKAPDGIITKADNHYNAAYYRTGENTGRLIHGAIPGFITDKGRFVTREEALPIARKANQLWDTAADRSLTGELTKLDTAHLRNQPSEEGLSQPDLPIGKTDEFAALKKIASDNISPESRRLVAGASRRLLDDANLDKERPGDRMQPEEEGLGYSGPNHSGWMSPSGKITWGKDHASIEKSLFGKPSYEASKLINNGWIRLNDIGRKELMFDGNPNEKQLGELNSLAIEQKLQLIDSRHDRYQPSSEGLSDDRFGYGFFSGIEAAADKAQRVSPRAAEAGRRWAVQRDIYEGWGNTAVKDLQKFDRADINRVIEVHNKAFRDKTELPRLSSKDAQISKILSRYFYDEMGQERRNLNMEINGREAGMNKTYVPHMLTPTAVDTMTKRPNSPESMRLRRLWAQHIVDTSARIDKPEFQVKPAEATEYVKTYVHALGGKEGHYTSVNFGALRKAEGYGLPEEMREHDALNLIQRYSKRAAADMAMFKEMESQKPIAAELGLFDPVTKKKAEHPDVVSLEDDPAIQNMMKWVTGNFSGGSFARVAPTTSALVRLTNNLLLGPATAIRDTAQIPVMAVPYITRLSDLGAVWKGLANVSNNSRESLKFGAKKPNLDTQQFSDMFESPNPVVNIIRKAATLARVWQGREAIENWNRDVTFSIGKELAKHWIVGAKADHAKSKLMLEKFGTLVDGDVTTMKGKELERALNIMGKNFTDRNQGTYGLQGLPVGIVDNQFAPFFALQKWSVEKSNVIYKDVVKPFLTGENRIPLMTYALGTVLTGAAIQKLNELMSNKKGQDPTWQEALDKGDTKAIVSELATLMQLASFGGILGDGLKFATDVGLRGKTPRNIVSFPTATAALNFEEKTKQMLEAINQGENPWDVFKLYALDLITAQVQAARLVANHTIREENVERSDKFRDRRVYKELEGKPASNITAANPYLGLDAKDFKRTGNLREAVGMLPSLIERKQQEAGGNYEKLRTGLRSLKGNSYQTMPSIEDTPMEFQNYYQFLVRTQGKEAADARLQDYLRQRSVNKVKSSLVPSLR